MSGIADASSACDTTAPVDPFSVSATWHGSTTQNVSSASGTCTGYVVIIVSGGVPPDGQGAGDGFSLVSPTGGVGFGVASDGIHTTLTWSGLTTVGSYCGAAVKFTSTDSAGTKKTSTTATVLIQRTS